MPIYTTACILSGILGVKMISLFVKYYFRFTTYCVTSFEYVVIFLFRSGRNKQFSYKRPQEVGGNFLPSRVDRSGARDIRWGSSQGWRLWQGHRRRWRRSKRNSWKFRCPIPLVQLYFHLAHLESRQLCGRLGTQKIVYLIY